MQSPDRRNTPASAAPIVRSHRRQAFQAIREAAGEVAYRDELERYGWRDFQAMRNAIDNKAPNAKEKAVEAYWHLDAIVRKGVA